MGDDYFNALESFMTLISSPPSAVPAKPAPIALEQFLEATPPGQYADISVHRNVYQDNSVGFDLPTVQLFCTHDGCNGIRFFDTSAEINLKVLKDCFWTYNCRNCKTSKKTFSVRVSYDAGTKVLTLLKYGEVPGFGPPTPARVRSLVGSEGDYYFKGLKAENQSLGIAAFAYYRRIVEHQKDKIFDEIIRVAERLGESPDLIAQLQAAKKETQFTSAVDSIKLAIPQVLRIDGHNPLTLLHSALSEGLHAQSDAECLELATSIRIVLTEFVERVGIALKNDAELKTAVSRLFKKPARGITVDVNRLP